MSSCSGHELWLKNYKKQSCNFLSQPPCKAKKSTTFNVFSGCTGLPAVYVTTSTPEYIFTCPHHAPILCVPICR